MVFGGHDWGPEVFRPDLGGPITDCEVELGGWVGGWVNRKVEENEE